MEAEQHMILMQQFRQYELKAERTVFEMLYAPLCLYAHEIITDITQAEDIVIDAIQKAFEKRTEFEAIGNLKAFLYKVVRNESINKKQQFRSRAAIHEKIGFESKEHYSDPEMNVHEREILRIELLQEIYKEINSLPKKCKIIFEKIFFHGQSTEQIAKDLHSIGSLF